VRASDLVLVMDTSQEKALIKRYLVAHDRVVQVGDLDPQLDTGRTIADPWGRSDEVFAACFARLDRCADVLIRDLAVTG
jgi:protein-tyrosine-phosphatase